MEHPLEANYDNKRWMTVTRYQGHGTELPLWIYRLAAADFLDYDASDEQKARETAGDAILNYEAHIVTSMRLLSRSGSLPDAESVKWYSASFVSNRKLYQNPISRQLAIHARVLRGKWDYPAMGQNPGEFRCIGKFFGDLFEKLVFSIFEDEQRYRRRPWYDMDPVQIQDIVDTLGVIDASRFRRDMQLFHLRVTKANRLCRTGSTTDALGSLESRSLERQRDRVLAKYGKYGFETNRSTSLFLETVLRSHPGSLNICGIMGYIRREHMRLPIVLDAFYRDLEPCQIHVSREKCELQQSEDWYQLIGAMIMDRRASSRTGTLDYLILIRLYDDFFKCPFT